MTTDKDILAALEGKPSAERAKADEEIRRAFRGERSREEQEHIDAIAEAFGNKRERRAREGEKPIKTRGDHFESVSVWAAQEAVAQATRELAEAIMRADGGKNIYAAEAEARGIAEEAYDNAAKKFSYEDDRQREVERILGTMAMRVGRSRTAEAKKPALRTSPVKASEAIRRRVQITETGRTGHITNL